MLANLANVLPLLALAGLAVPTAAAGSHGVARHPRDRQHAHYERALFRNSTPRGSLNKRSAKIIRRADGSQCRVRPAASAPAAPAAPAEPAPAPPAGESSDAASPTTSDAAATPDAAPTPEPTPQENQLYQDSNEFYNPDTDSVNNPKPTGAPAPPPAEGCKEFRGANKYGLAWPNGDWALPQDGNYVGNYIGSRTAWYYTWHYAPLAGARCEGLEFVPMLWGPSHVWEFQNSISSWGPEVRHALFYNEPNQAGQADQSPEASIGNWMNVMVPLRHQKGISLGAAATTSAPSGLEWVVKFKQVCIGAGNSEADCTSDFTPVHYYDVSTDHFKQYLENYHNGVGQDLWVTEYACQNFNGGAQCGFEETIAFHRTMADHFDRTPWIARYSPFGVMKAMQDVGEPNRLMYDNGYITPLGTCYQTGDWSKC